MKAVRSITLPRRVLIGHDVLDEVGTVCGELDLGGSLVVAYDKGTLKAAGAKVLDVLRNDGFTVTAFEVTDGGPADVDALQNTARDHGAIVAVGGGRVIDVSKAAGFMAAIPFVSIPTAASHDGIASAQASLIEEGQRHSLAAIPPVAIVADTAVIAKAPPRLYRAGCGDIISNFTAVLDWQLARRLHNEYYG
ncbi:MAG: iron-containing alcohol dehydrogenase, partial [Methanopyri archaeon]|nr:iron-containing alcohol dehydrogenase [Methanopyri archaeon]